MIAHAADSVELAYSFVDQINQVILFPLITLLTVVALVIFLWGCFQFVYYASSDTKRAEGRQHILWGIIGLLVMLSAYAILTVAGNTIGVDPDQYNRSGATSAPFRSPNPQARPEAFAPETSSLPETRPYLVDSSDFINSTTFSNQELLNRYNNIPGTEQSDQVLFAENHTSETDTETFKVTCQDAGGNASFPFVMLNGEGMSDNVSVIACFR